MDYKETLLLPNTTFPMRGNLTQNEPARYSKWIEKNIYNKMKQNRKEAKKFTLHDGPPYANGNIHIGHALNKVLKDIIVKYNYFQGKSVRFTPGWDCHGLPIEQQVEKDLGKEKKESLPKTKLRELCRAHAKKYVDIQREEFKSLGVVADWENPYVTMDFKFEANIYRELVRVAKAGLLKERKKPVYWSWAAKTALAEAEVEYQDKEDYSIYISFELSDEAKKKLDIDGKKAGVVIWTTTPWTIPANVAISLNPEEEYVLTNDGYIVAQKRHEALLNEKVIKGDVIKSFKASLLEKLTAINPLNQRDSLLILGEHVLMENGSGCVHTAPGHGEDDYRVGLKYDLEVVMPVDENGKYDETIASLKLLPNASEYVSKHIFDMNDEIINLLGDSVLSVKKFMHSYPHCWRTHKPVIFRATKQWFIVMDENKKDEDKTLREIAVDEIQKTSFNPSWGQNRLKSMVENRPDWCISRQRDWGVPIAFFKDKKTGEIILDDKVLNFIAGIFDTFGADAWYSMEIKELLYPGAPYDADDLEKVNDILDVWFDSGSTQFAVLKSLSYDAGEFPADVYLEGSDQHRGWFQSSLLTSCATNSKAPYKSVITHGFTVDEKGEKMSKSKGNVVAPSKVIKQHGSEILRLWVAMSDFTLDVKISDNILNQIAEQYRKLRNTIRFLLANIGDLEMPLEVEKMGVLDRWILSRAKEVFDEAKEAYDNYDFAKAFHKISNFLTVDLSGIYLDLCKDKLYCDGKNDIHRQASQSAMFYIVRTLLGLIAPVLTHTADEALEHAPAVLRGKCEDLFDFEYAAIPDVISAIDTAYFKEAREKFNTIVDELKKEKIIKNTLELVLVTDSKNILAIDFTEAQDWFVVSGVVDAEPKEELASFKVQNDNFYIVKSTKHKCPRCWKFSADKEDGLCPRCDEVVNV
ncbi:MAG: isoleucyl-tRNA synthetase [Campylobacterota bacterium]|nr:isoleucyl-tRNA synthetase [Campylobacterota bacterium]